MLITLSRKISYAGLGCPECWFPIMDDNLTMHYSKTSVNTSGFRIITPHPPIRKQMIIRLGLRGQGEYGQTSYQVFYGRTG